MPLFHQNAHDLVTIGQLHAGCLFGNVFASVSRRGKCALKIVRVFFRTVKRRTIALVVKVILYLFPYSFIGKVVKERKWIGLFCTIDPSFKVPGKVINGRHTSGDRASCPKKPH